MPGTLETPAAAAIDGLRRARAAIYTSGEVPAATGSPHRVWPIGLTPERGQTLRDLVVREKAKNALETGFAFAMSSSWILDGLLTNWAASSAAATMPDGPILTSVDPFATRAWRDADSRHLAEAGCGHYHRLHRVGSELLLPRLVADPAQPRFDFIFIDGDHRFEYVFSDILHARRLIREGGLIVVDDAWMPSVRKCIAFFRSARLVVEEPSPGQPAADRFFLLRVDPAGEDRPWDHFAEF